MVIGIIFEAFGLGFGMVYERFFQKAWCQCLKKLVCFVQQRYSNYRISRHLWHDSVMHRQVQVNWFDPGPNNWIGCIDPKWGMWWLKIAAVILRVFLLPDQRAPGTGVFIKTGRSVRPRPPRQRLWLGWAGAQWTWNNRQTWGWVFWQSSSHGDGYRARR